jgi:hypothetical protein
MKMEAAGSSKTLLPIYQSTRRRVPEKSNLRSHRRKNLKFHATTGHVIFLTDL